MFVIWLLVIALFAASVVVEEVRKREEERRREESAEEAREISRQREEFDAVLQDEARRQREREREQRREWEWEWEREMQRQQREIQRERQRARTIQARLYFEGANPNQTRQTWDDREAAVRWFAERHPARQWDLLVPASEATPDELWWTNVSRQRTSGRMPVQGNPGHILRPGEENVLVQRDRIVTNDRGIDRLMTTEQLERWLQRQRRAYAQLVEQITQPVQERLTASLYYVGGPDRDQRMIWQGQRQAARWFAENHPARRWDLLVPPSETTPAELWWIGANGRQITSGRREVVGNPAVYLQPEQRNVLVERGRVVVNDGVVYRLLTPEDLQLEQIPANPPAD